MALNQQQAAMLAHIMAALQEASSVPGAQQQGLPGGVPPPGPPPPPPGQALQPPAGDMGFVSKVFWELGPVDQQAIARELEKYNEFLASGSNPPTKLSVISGRASLSAFLSTRLGETRPLIMHSLGIYGDMVARSNFRGQFLGLTGDSLLDSRPPILWQRDPNLMISDRNVRAPPVAIELFYSTHYAEVFMPLNAAYPQEVVQRIVCLLNVWVHHLINLESHFEAFTAINRIVATLSPAGQAAAKTLGMWSRASCVAYPNANNLQIAGILSALWTDVTPDSPLIQYAHGLHQDLHRALPMPVSPIPQPVQQAMTPADITQIIADTNRRNAPARLWLSPLQTNQIRG
jgi:hypothetical protein